MVLRLAMLRIRFPTDLQVAAFKARAEHARLHALLGRYEFIIRLSQRNLRRRGRADGLYNISIFHVISK